MNRIPAIKEIALATLGATCFAAAWAVGYEQDLGWDLRNYHYYTVYAWLEGRLTYHIAPAQLQNWLNPLAHWPYYVLINGLPPVITGAIFGALGGISIALAYLLARLIMPAEQPWAGAAVAALSAGVAASGPEFLELVGTTDSNVLVNIPILGALLVICWSHCPGRPPASQDTGYLACGLLLGAACGLRFTVGIYALGLTLSLLILWPLLRFSRRGFLFYAAGGVAGALLTGGYWSWMLWSEYGNPFFPYFNQYFRSPWIEASSFRDLRWLPESAGSAALTYPFQWLTGVDTTSESDFFDARFAPLAVLLPVTIVGLAAEAIARWRKRSEPSPARPFLISREHFWLLILFFAFSYAIWVKAFSVQRYLMPLCFLSGVVLFLLLDRLLASHASKVTVFAVFAVFSMTWNESFPSQRVRYGKDWFGVSVPPAMAERNLLHVLVGDAPMSYVIPFLPDSARAVRITGNLRMDTKFQLGARAREIIRQHDGPVRSLSEDVPSEAEQYDLARFGLRLESSDCATVRTHIDEFISCPLVRDDPRQVLRIDMHRRSVLWNYPSDSGARVYVQMDGNPPTVFATGTRGEQEAGWLSPGHRYRFELFEWDGISNGRLLATATVDEQGNVQQQPADGSEN